MIMNVTNTPNSKTRQRACIHSNTFNSQYLIEIYRFLFNTSLLANPEKPYIRIRDCSLDADSNVCTYKVSKGQKDVQLSCTVYGAKPEVSVLWEINGFANETVNLTSTETLTLDDGTFNTTSVLKWKVKLDEDADENITCVAEGLAVSGRAELYTTFEEVEPAGEFYACHILHVQINHGGGVKS